MENKYAKGLYGKLPKSNAPDFVIGQISVKADDFIQFLNENKNPKGYVNLDLTKGREEKMIIKLSTYEPKDMVKSPIDAHPF